MWEELKSMLIYGNYHENSSQPCAQFLKQYSIIVYLPLSNRHMLQVDFFPQAYLHQYDQQIQVPILHLCPTAIKVSSIKKLIKKIKEYALQHMGEPAQFGKVTIAVSLLNNFIIGWQTSSQLCPPCKFLLKKQQINFKAKEYLDVVLFLEGKGYKKNGANSAIIQNSSLLISQSEKWHAILEKNCRDWNASAKPQYTNNWTAEIVKMPLEKQDAQQGQQCRNQSQQNSFLLGLLEQCNSKIKEQQK